MATSGMKSSSTLVAVIGDEDTVTGFLLAGIGERNSKGEANFLVVDESKRKNSKGLRNPERTNRGNFQ